MIIMTHLFAGPADQLGHERGSGLCAVLFTGLPQTQPAVPWLSGTAGSSQVGLGILGILRHSKAFVVDAVTPFAAICGSFLEFLIMTTVACLIAAASDKATRPCQFKHIRYYSILIIITTNMFWCFGRDSQRQGPC